jgi:hypothetical protein
MFAIDRLFSIDWMAEGTARNSRPGSVARFPHSYTLFSPFSAATLYASANVG